MESHAELSDAELRTELKRYGFHCGPILPSTRSVYLKKLMKLRSTEPNNTNSIEFNEKTRPTRGPQRSSKRKIVENTNTVAKSETIQNARVDRDGLDYLGVTSAVSPQIPTQKSQTLTGGTGMSTRSPVKASGTSQTSSSVISSTTVPSINRYTDSHNANTLASNAITRNTTPQRAAGHTPTRKTYLYYRETDSDACNSASETDDDSFKRPGPFSGALSRVSGWLNRSQGRTSLTDRKAATANRLSFSGSPAIGRRSTGTGYDDARLQVSDTDQSDVDMGGHRSSLFGKAAYSSIKSKNFASPRLPTGLSRQAFSEISDDDFAGSYGDHGPTPSLKRRQGLGPPVHYTSGPLYRWMSPHVPNLILISGVLVLVGLTLSYIVLRDHHGEVGKMADLERLICPSTIGLPRCLDQKQVTKALPLLSTTFDILSRYSGEYHCGSGRQSSPRLPVVTVGRLVQNKLSPPLPDAEFPAVWDDALFLLLHVGKVHFSLIAFDSLGKELTNTSDIRDIHELQSLQPYFPGACRISLWLAWLSDVLVTAFWFVLVAVLVLAGLWSLHWVRSKRLQYAEERSARIRELVGEIVRILQNQLRENETNPDQPPYLPVYFLRDRLRQAHSDALQLWPDISRYVYEIETCILVQEWRGLGETWQWQGGTGWQGSALLDKSQKAPFAVPPTECLKIRNMFSTESLDERAKRRIKRELLKKLIPCGSIYHIGLDSVGTKGLVYVKCANQDTAGRVYHSIHANYFDGRLLTVKFLRNTKYCLRFPEAHNACQPLTLGHFE